MSSRDERVRRRGGGDIPVGDRRRKALANRRGDPRQRHDPVIAAKPPSKAALGKRPPRCSRAISLAGTVRMWPAEKRCAIVLDARVATLPTC